MNRSFFLLCAALSAIVISGCGGKGGDELAVINGETIGMEELHRYLETKTEFLVTQVDQSTNMASLAQTPAFQGLLDLVTRKVTLQLAKDKGVDPKAEDVERELEFRKKINAQYASTLMGMGLTLQQIKDQIAFDLSRERLVSKGVTVTDADVDKFIKENPKRFTTTEQVQLIYIQANTPETKRKVEKELALGKPFQNVAMSYSDSSTIREDNGRVNGGRPAQTSLLSPNLRKAIKTTAERKHTGWIKFQNTEAMFYLEKRLPAKKVAIDAVLKERVKRDLTQQKGMQAVDLNKQLSVKVLDSKIDVKNKSLKPLWDRYIEALRRATEQGPAPGIGG